MELIRNLQDYKFNAHFVSDSESLAVTCVGVAAWSHSIDEYTLPASGQGKLTSRNSTDNVAAICWPDNVTTASLYFRQLYPFKAYR